MVYVSKLVTTSWLNKLELLINIFYLFHLKKYISFFHIFNMRLIFSILNLVIAINHEQRLVSRLLKNYNREIRPIRNVSEVIHVRFYMTLQQMISVVEKVF